MKMIEIRVETLPEKNENNKVLPETDKRIRDLEEKLRNIQEKLKQYSDEYEIMGAFGEGDERKKEELLARIKMAGEERRKYQTEIERLKEEKTKNSKPKPHDNNDEQDRG